MNNISKIEIIPIGILGEHQQLSSELVQMGKSLALSSGWHYVLDWTWVASNIGDVNDKIILDAGAGIGLLQWYFASKGANVISVDRSDRTCVPFHLPMLFNLQGYSQKDNPLNFIELLNITNRKATFPRRIKSLARGVAGYIAGTNRSHLKNGTVSFLNCDLRNLAEIKDNSVDIVVSVSSLEHNEHISTVKAIVQELERILMPGGRMLITLPAAHKQDWFFVPAYSWCFTDNTIRDIFNFSRDVSSNYSHYEHHFDNIKRSKDLKKNLSWRYFFTRKSGMPLGKWEPKYIPVGIIKIKQV